MATQHRSKPNAPRARRIAFAVAWALAWGTAPGAALAADATQRPPRCPPAETAATQGGPEPLALREGLRVGYRDLLRLRAWLPAEVWRNRNTFFHARMQMEIGPCFRRYALPGPPSGDGSFSVDDAGNLVGAGGGLPFPPATLDPAGADAGARWAWNVERRDRGAGPHGRFRIVDKPGRTGATQTYTGEWHQWIPPREGDADDEDAPRWVAGGRFASPGSVRHLAWKQTRRAASDADFEAPDATFVYLPSLRRVRRAASAWSDGLFMPRYRAGRAAGGERALPLGGGAAVSAGGSVAATEHLRRGFLGLSLRPNAYVWRLEGERDVLAPLNVSRSGYPKHPGRDFGPSGLSAASDRWELRRAVLLHGDLRARGGDYDRLTLYVDAQTAQPLYYITKRRDGRLVEVGILLHRYSGDQAGYPPGRDGEPLRVFDPVAAVFYETRGGGSGWRRESYDVRSTPLSDAERERWLAPGALERRG
ncbi:MAG: DUF1329 domain-containing protein [Myxococcota bacterium]